LSEKKQLKIQTIIIVKGHILFSKTIKISGGNNMKLRSDFVTNSSSSSFVISRKGELTEKQKAAVISYVEEKMLGKKLLSPDSTEEEIERALEEECIDEEYHDQIREALKNGETVYSGWIDFEESDYHYGKLLENLWQALEESDDGGFNTIDGDLSY
jgi:hypothetical protein